jgi:hypothetical protein
MLPSVLIISTGKKEGNLDFRFGSFSQVRQQWTLLERQHRFSFSDVVFADQQHGGNIQIISRSLLTNDYFGATRITGSGGIDGMITAEKNIFLAIVTADCLPVFFYDIQQHVVGIAHCGWKGVLRQLAVQMVDRFQHTFHSHPHDIHIVVGPSIHGCCYKVDQAPDHRIDRFIQEFGHDCVQGGYLFLHKALQQQLIERGIEEKRIQMASECTSCNPSFYSYYRDKKNLQGQQVHIIGMRS